VQVFTTNVDGPGVSPVPLGTAVDMDGVAVTYFETAIGRRLYRSPAMGRALEAAVPAFDIVHLHSVFLWPTAKAACVARAAGVPYVLAPRGMLVGDLIRNKSRLLKSAWIFAFERRNLEHAAALHVTSDIEAAEIRQLALANRGFAVIPNGIDLPSLGEFEAQRGSTMQPIILALGRLSWKKGLDRLIEAMAHVPDARLVIAGNDDEGYQSRLEEIAIQFGVRDRTQFVGPVYGDEKWRLFASADVFALPSYSENFGNVVLEAMASGVPVVVTAEVGLAETVAEGAGLVTEGTPAAIGAALSRLICSPVERERMGAVGQRLAAERFSWGAVSGNMEQAYKSIVGVRT
jgi:glycosyltransferase involved in cell wall biosynthesis